MSRFITNDKELTQKVISDYLGYTKNASFLVGYFYFSGLLNLVDDLKQIKLRILVGMEIEKTLGQGIKEYSSYFDSPERIGDFDLKHRYFNSLKNLINGTSYFDSEKQEQMLRIFFDKIEDGSLQIRKTREPNHAKMYIFEYKDPRRQNHGAVITGSSNLTYSGMADRKEVNVELSEDDYFDALKIFDDLWETSVEITSEDFSKNVKPYIWLDNTPTPYLLFLKVLDEYFTESEERIFLPHAITEGRYHNLTYQVDAVKHTIETVKKHNGVIIADVVGLGKSIIAAAAAHNLNLHTIIICPPHLKDQWEEYRSDMKINARVYSGGMLERIEKEMVYGREYMIIVDEAHKYRNESTSSYGMLHRICQGNKVMLLTATPLNNRPDDLYSMIKLFQVPGNATLSTTDNLHSAFAELIRRYKKILKDQKKEGRLTLDGEKLLNELALELRRIVAPVVIRRTRQDLKQIKKYAQNLKEQKIVFPTVEDPIMLEYSLGNLTDLYIDTLENISPSDENAEGFVGARYMPLIYLKEDKKKLFAKHFNVAGNDIEFMTDSQSNLAAFMRRLVVARFESSLAAFKITLDNMILSSESILKWYREKGIVPLWKRGHIPDPDNFDLNNSENDSDFGDDAFEQQLIKMQEEGLLVVKADYLKPIFIEKLEKDILLLKQIRSKWEKITPEHDPKLSGIKEEIAKQLKNDPKRKIIIFSQYADTVSYLAAHLTQNVTAYTSRKRASARETVLRNFDANHHTKHDDFQVLVATDAISEGYNLSRAGTVINYDIPYNPVRVIQRIGRINRVNAKSFEKLFIYNFFPSPKGEDEIRIKAISTLKMSLIGKMMGQDSKVLDKSETLHSPFGKMFSELYNQQEDLSWDVPYRNLIDGLRENDPKGYLANARALPSRTRICRKAVGDKRRGLLVFGKRGAESVFRFVDDDNNQTALSAEAALSMFSAVTKEDAMTVRPPFHEMLKAATGSMFKRKTIFTLDLELRKSLDTVNALKSALPKEADYLNDLHVAIKDFGGVPDFQLKQIRTILKGGKITPQAVESLKKEIPHRYLRDIINTTKTNRLEETVIVAEQFF